MMPDITTELDILASEFEHIDPRISLALDQISDKIERIKQASGTLADWQHEPLAERLGNLYLGQGQTFKVYFHPKEMQKNGGIKGVAFSVHDDRIVGHASTKSVPKSEFNWYKKIDYREVDKKIADKISEKLKTF